jgi:hypothetical protein
VGWPRSDFLLGERIISFIDVSAFTHWQAGLR